MYDILAGDYDRFVNWPARLAGELPFLERELSVAGARTVLDAACGTGRHALELARRGYAVSGADSSSGMIDRAHANAAAAGAAVRFERAGFGVMAGAFGTSAFDALLCLGNSLPHAANPSGLQSALADFSACLKPGGLLILQNRNFDRVLAVRERWLEPQNRAEDGRELLFLRFYDFESDGSLTFHVVTLERTEGGGWKQSESSARIWPLREEELTRALAAAGFDAIRRFGGAAGGSFVPNASPDLIVTAQKGS